jgi:glycosyltransferase involved in cell wall biosynthesis
MRDEVTICIAAYNAAAFLGGTIDSVLAQTHRGIRVVVSVDAGEDSTVEVAAGYAHRGVRVLEQNARLGWVGNTNAALALAETSHAMILPHDDVIDPTYVTECLAALDAHPDAVLACSDLQFGTIKAFAQESVEGDLHSRMHAYLRGHFEAVAFRGVFDRRRATRHIAPTFAAGDFAADTLWIAQMLTQGEMVRVPRILYHKHLLKSSVHAAWSRTSRRELEEMWVTHCCELDRTIRESGVMWDDRLEAAWEARLMYRRDGGAAPPPAGFDPSLPLRPQAEAIYERVRQRRPPYSWAG